jgi:MFS superfamily sulfate permease-like transporter
MYLSYYIPLVNWIQQYRLSYVRGDLVAALTMASFYIPMALSYASNLGHVPPVSGLYAFVFNPFIYAVLGTCPQMVVGPEAAGSLLTGQVVRENINKGRHDDENDQRNAEVAGIVTFMAGAVILLAGLFRLGFLDNVLSRPFLRGFISAIGIVIFVDQLIPEMGLSEIASHTNGVAHGSTLDKAVFVVRNLRHAHALTCAVSFGAFAIILVCRELKHRLQPRFPSVAYIPDRFLVVVLSAVLAWKFRWDQSGVSILGDIKTHGKPFAIHFPFSTLMHLQYASDAFSTAFVIALLGFFESSVAAKSLGTGDASVLKNMNLSANRELVALGVANVCGGLFMALPAFGGYGRSKVNANTGGKTPMSSIFVCIITVICILFLLPYFYYLPVSPNPVPNPLIQF